MSEHHPLLIPGSSTTGGTIEIRAPFDDALIATADAADDAAVDRALSTALSRFTDRDGRPGAGERVAILDRTASIMERRAEELAFEAAREGGKPLADSKVEVARAIDGVRSCIEFLRTQSGREIPMDLNPASAGRLAVTRHEPAGVVVAVSAFNHPLNLAVHQVCPAVAAGCPVIIKPAEDTPLSTYRLVAMLREAGLPDDWCQALVVRDLEVASALVTDARVAFFSFVGSARVGWMLRSRLAPGTRCALEHGGAAPVIVAEDADLDAVVPALAKAGFYHAGQVCVSVQRVFAHRSIARELATRLAAAASRLEVGDPTLGATDVGPLIRPRETDRVEEWVEEAIAAGAERLTGGTRISNSCFECTVLFDPPAAARVSRLEIFGPVVNVYPFDALDDAIDRANELPYAFQAAVFTECIDTAMRAYRRFNASAVMVNDHTAFRVDWMPFAGLRESGLGVGGIPYTMRDMQIEKMLVIKSREL